MPGASRRSGVWLSTSRTFWAQRADVVAFTVWYADGGAVRGEPNAWSSAPTHDVVVLAVFYVNGDRELIVGLDEYTFPHQPGTKLGGDVDDATFDRIADAATRDIWSP